MIDFVEKIEFDGNLLGIILRDEYKKEGISFFTPNEFSQQLAFMKHKKGKIIDPHIHNLSSRKITQTQEVLIIKKGILKVDFYNNKKDFVCSRKLKKGDIVLLASGGHGFEVIEDIEMVEIKQGPYLGDMDKVRFSVNK